MCGVGLAISAFRCRCRRSITCFRRVQISRRHPGHRDSVRHLRSGRGDGQRRERGRRRRRFPDHAGADGRRRDQPDRLPDGQSVHQRRLYRPSRLEGDGRADRLFGGDRHHGDAADLVRHHRRDDGADPGRRDPADPALHRHADRLAGVPGNAASSCAGDRAGAAAADCSLGQDADRQRTGRGWHQPRRSASTSWRRSACCTRGWKRWAAARRWPA